MHFCDLFQSKSTFFILFSTKTEAANFKNKELMDVDMIGHFSVPTDYNPPPDNQLNGNTQFPNLNSVEFRNRPQEDTTNLLPFYECLEANEDQTTILLTTNSYTQRLWNGTVFGFGRFADVGKRDSSIIQLGFDANLTGCRFIDRTLVLFTTANGTIQLWSTQSEVRKQNGYNLYQVSKKSEHIGSITSFCVMNNHKAITGATDGCLKVNTLASSKLNLIGFK